MNSGLYGLSRDVPTRIRAWVVFNGADGTIFESEGIKSVTRTATGNYTIELDGMNGARWCWGGNCQADSGAARFGWVCMGSVKTDNSIVIRTVGATVAPGVAAYDPGEVTFFVIQ